MWRSRNRKGCDASALNREARHLEQTAHRAHAPRTVVGYVCQLGWVDFVRELLPTRVYAQTYSEASGLYVPVHYAESIRFVVPAPIEHSNRVGGAELRNLQ